MDEGRKNRRSDVQVYARVWQRVLALLVDVIVVTTPLTLISYIVMGNWRGDWITVAIETFYWLVIPVLTRGLTIGKWLIGIRIEMRKGSDPGLWCIFLRYGVVPLFYVLSFGVLLLVSYGMMILRADRKSLHDVVANTVVVKNSVPKYMKQNPNLSA